MLSSLFASIWSLAGAQAFRSGRGLLAAAENVRKIRTSSWERAAAETVRGSAKRTGGSYKMRRLSTGLVIATLAACTKVDSTEHCVETRFGSVVNEKMGTGLNLTLLTDATCFPLTEQNYPAGRDASGQPIPEEIEAQTQDPVTVTGDVAVTWAYDPATVPKVFRDKRSQSAAEIEVVNAIREGYRNALSQWTIAEVFANRAALSDSVHRHIQSKLVDRARIRRVFVRDIKAPPVIEARRIAAAVQAQILDSAQKQLAIDSMNARGRVLRAEAAARETELQGASYAKNPELLRLEIARAQAEGLGSVCRQAQTCIVGGSALDALVPRGTQ
jgi:hypothetical protein